MPAERETMPLETMHLEVENHLGAVERSVARTEREGQPARAVVLARAFATTVDDLWDAVTSAERLPRWFLPISGELKPGGRFQLEGHAGGAITACEQPAHCSFTWEFGDDTSWVELRVAEAGAGGARLTLTHTSHLSDHWKRYGPGAAGVGWEMALLGLALHLAHPDEPKPDAAAFVASPDGRTLITGASAGWARAAAAAGEDPDAARVSGERTAAFYTGQPELA